METKQNESELSKGEISASAVSGNTSCGSAAGGPKEFNHITQSFIATELDLASHIMLKKICNLVVNIMKMAKKGFYIIDSGAGY